MLLRAQFADDRAEYTGSDRLVIGFDEDGRVGIEADSRPVGAVDVLRGTDDDGLVDVALLHAAARRRFLDGDDDAIADAGETPLRTAQHLDALNALGSGLVGDLKVRLNLDPRSIPFLHSTEIPPANTH